MWSSKGREEVRFSLIIRHKNSLQYFHLALYDQLLKIRYFSIGIHFNDKIWYGFTNVFNVNRYVNKSYTVPDIFLGNFKATGFLIIVSLMKLAKYNDALAISCFKAKLIYNDSIIYRIINDIPKNRHRKIIWLHTTHTTFTLAMIK